MVEAHHHRSTLKQQNKRFKSKHATKSSLKDMAKGRVPRQSPRAVSSSTAAQSRLNRRNNAKQAQSQKRLALISSTRIFSGINGVPRIVAVVPLTDDVDARTVASSLAASLEISPHDCPRSGLWTIRAERFKTSLQFINLPYKSMYTTLDACKAADYVVFVLSSVVEVDNWGDVLLRTLQAQGLPDVVTVVSPNDSLDPKTRPAILKSLLSFIQYFVPTQARVFDLHASSDRLNALRALSEGKPGDVRWREGRAWIVGEHAEWDDGVLRVTGVVRGAALSANRLIHIPNYGDFQISKIMSAPTARISKSESMASMEVEPVVMAEPDQSSADSLVSRNDVDELENEQTWPAEEEMQGVDNVSQSTDLIPDAQKGTTPKYVKRIPKGMSEYQAAWIIDSDDDDDDDREDGAEKHDYDDVESGDVDGGNMQDMQVIEECEEMEDKNVDFQDLDVEEEAKQLESWRNREREEENDLTFPDEIDTPKDVPARTRFQRFRGMRSFRTSPWDPYENLPKDYARIFQFEDFKRTERGVRRRGEKEIGNVQIGVRVTVYLTGVPQETARASPIFLFPLLQHEHKFSVLNFSVQRNTEYKGSVRSKDPLILCIGPRRLRVQPIYSQHTRGGGKGVNNVHKFERYLKHGFTSVATTYGPVLFGKQSCVLLKETSDSQGPQLVAMGTFLNPDTTRIIAKRFILTGHPFKVHKKTATVRYMFFNSGAVLTMITFDDADTAIPDDVEYFKPIQLQTKYGRIGHIRESLGTHGYFKAHFDGAINQMDTVCMSLYKRVFPKWGELWGGDRIVYSDSMEE